MKTCACREDDQNQTSNASDFAFQGQSQNIVSISEFKFKSGISGNVPPGLCQIEQLKSEREGYGVVFFSNCNPHTNNKSIVTLTYLNLGQTQSAGFFSEEMVENWLSRSRPRPSYSRTRGPPSTCWRPGVMGLVQKKKKQNSKSNLDAADC